MASTKKTPRVNFYKKYQLHKVCSIDELMRPVMNYIFFRNGYAYATNAYCAVKARIEDISSFEPEEIALLDGYLLHRKHYAMLLKSNLVQIEKVKDPETGEESVCFRSYVDEDIYMKIPLVKVREGFRFMDCDKAVFNNYKEEVPTNTIGFRFELLEDIADAMGIEQRVRMIFHGIDKPIEITSKEIEDDGCDLRGIIMPILDA